VQADGGVELAVADAGRGFDPVAVGAQGLGLVSMAERARLLGGTFQVRSAPGAGTELRARIPLPPAEHDAGVQPAEEEASVVRPQWSALRDGTESGSG